MSSTSSSQLARKAAVASGVGVSVGIVVAVGKAVSVGCAVNVSAIRATAVETLSAVGPGSGVAVSVGASVGVSSGTTATTSVGVGVGSSPPPPKIKKPPAAPARIRNKRITRIIGQIVLFLAGVTGGAGGTGAAISVAIIWSEVAIRVAPTAAAPAASGEIDVASAGAIRVACTPDTGG